MNSTTHPNLSDQHAERMTGFNAGLGMIAFSADGIEA